MEKKKNSEADGQILKESKKVLLVPAENGTLLCGGGEFGNTISAVRQKKEISSVIQLRRIPSRILKVTSGFILLSMIKVQER